MAKTTVIMPKTAFIIPYANGHKVILGNRTIIPNSTSAEYISQLSLMTAAQYSYQFERDVFGQRRGNTFILENIVGPSNIVAYLEESRPLAAAKGATEQLARDYAKEQGVKKTYILNFSKDRWDEI
jgi:hypothetical protein